MSLLNMYYYLFYKLYKFFNFFNPKLRPAEISAVCVILLLEVWVVFSCYNYYDVLFHHKEGQDTSLLKFFVPIIIFSLVAWLAFWRNDTWRVQLEEFDKWSADKNKKGTWIVFFLIIIISANLAFSFYLNPPVNGWKQ